MLYQVVVTRAAYGQLALEVVSELGELAPANDGAREGDEGHMQVGVAVPADSQEAEVVQPGEGALDHPAPAAEAWAVLGWAAGDHRLDAHAPQRSPLGRVVIGAVGDHPVGALARTPALAGDPTDPVDQGKQLPNVVAVAASKRRCPRHPTRVGDQVVLWARAPTVNRRRPRGPPGEGADVAWVDEPARPSSP